MEKLREEVMRDFIECGVFRPGEFPTKWGTTQPYWISLERLRSFPDAMNRLTGLLVRTIYSKNLRFDLLSNVSSSEIPTVTQVSSATRIPMISPKKSDPKGSIEGCFTFGDRVLLVHEVVTNGGETLGVVKNYKKNGLQLLDIIVIVARLNSEWLSTAHEIRVHPVFSMTELLRFYDAEKLITMRDHDRINEHLSSLPALAL